MADSSSATAKRDGESERIHLAHAAPLSLGALTITPALRVVAHPDGREEVIEPRVMQVLVALVRAQGGIISRDDLLMSCWHGVVVGEDAINRVIGRLRRLLDGIGEGSHKLETITKVGYRLIPAGGLGPSVVVAAVAAPAPPLASEKPSIAVLPFVNLSGDAEQDYFADGMVEEIVTALSRIRSIFVIASGSSLSFRGEGASSEEIAGQLGVRYALEGSVRKAADRVRIAVKLVDVADRAQVWAERFEDDLKDVFALQDRVALAVAGVIEPRVQQAEFQRAAGRSTEHMGSYDLYLRALAVYRGGERAQIEEALALLDRAIAFDPGHGLALALAAVCHRDVVQMGWADDPAAHRRMATDLADRALRAAGDDPEVLAFAGAVLGALEADHATVLGLFDRAIALNPGSSTAWLSSGMMRLRAGDPETAAEHLQTSMRLDPRSPLRGRQLLGLGSAWFEQQRFDEAATVLKEAIRLLRIPSAYPLLIACHGYLEQPEEARAALARWAELDMGDIEDQAPKLLNPRQAEMFRAGLARLAGRL